MIHLNLIVLGKLKEEYWRQAEAEYLKRLSPYFKISITELREESFSEKDSSEIIKQKEAEKIISAIPKNSFLIILDETGKRFSSVDFAKELNNNPTIKQFNNLVFVIGGPLGLDKKVLALANLKLSLSDFTFTHQMARVFLLEQIYRTQMINSGKKYHY